MGLHAMKMTNRPLSVRLSTVIGAGRRRGPGKAGHEFELMCCVVLYAVCQISVLCAKVSMFL